MKILHTADWHLGKTLHQFSLLEQQRLAIQQILEIVATERPDVVLLAGDIYDRSVPPAEAVALFNETVSHLVLDLKVPLIAIAGNHDNPERIQYGAQLFEKQGFHVSGQFSYPLQPVEMKDEHGSVYFYLFPYTEPENLRFALQAYLPENELQAIQTHEDVFRWIVAHIQEQRQPTDRTILVAHAFVQGGVSSDSERKLLVGGAEYISSNIFEPITYMALGHLHLPQSFNEGAVQYSGSLLKYSVSEASHKKAVFLLELDETKISHCEKIELTPTQNLWEVRGFIEPLSGFELLEQYNYVQPNDYLYVKLENSTMQANAMSIIQRKYPNTLGLEWTKLSRNTSEGGKLSAEKVREMSEEDLFAKFYEDLTGEKIDEQKSQIINQMIAKIRN
jgi:exonuclease SbcD